MKQSKRMHATMKKMLQGKSSVIRRHMRRMSGDVFAMVVLATQLQRATRMLDSTYKEDTND
jgi:hypothetical protein